MEEVWGGGKLIGTHEKLELPSAASTVPVRQPGEPQEPPPPSKPDHTGSEGSKSIIGESGLGSQGSQLSRTLGAGSGGGEGNR